MQLDMMAFGAHPDDVELFAGGTLAKMASLGYSTGIVDLTRGELGSRGTPESRSEEAAKSARVLGAKIRENLRLADGNVQVTVEARLRIIKILREYRPEVVLVHHWDDRHPDHVNTSRLVAEAAHHAGLSKIETGQERFRPKALLYFKLPTPAVPSLIVDVADYQKERDEAIACYRSQLFDPSSQEPQTYLSQPDFLKYIESIHAYYGSLIGTRLGEGFFVKGVLAVPDPIEFFQTPSNHRYR